MAIIIGYGADSPLDAGADLFGAITVLDCNNPANGTGILTSMSFYFTSNGSSIKCGTFYTGGGNIYTCRDYETIGNVTGGGKQTFSGLSCNVTTGDILGITGNGAIGLSTSVGSGYNYKNGDGFTSSLTYSNFTTPGAIAIVGNGDGGKKWQGITISKWNGITSSKINSI